MGVAHVAPKGVWKCSPDCAAIDISPLRGSEIESRFRNMAACHHATYRGLWRSGNEVGS